MRPRYSPMMTAEELTAKAEQLRRLADQAIDPSYAESLRQRAQQLQAMAAEIRVLQSDPLYRRIHDRPNVGGLQ
jgi:flagellum-specific peptidoglycan hydrolase FlgJ